MWKAWSNLNLASKIFIMMVLGILAGVVFGSSMTAVKPLGDMFIKAIQMMVILVIVPSMISGFSSVENPKDIGRTGIKIIGLFAITTIIAGTLALLLVNIMKPGVGMILEIPQGFKYVPKSQGAVEMFANIIPQNPVAAFASGNLLQILFVTIFFAATMSVVSKKNSAMKVFFDEWSEISMRMLGKVMDFAPYATFALLAWAIGVNGPHILGPLFFFILCIWAGEVVLMGLNVGICAAFGLNPIVFLKNMLEVIMLALSTCSSLACLGANLKTVERLGVPKGIGTFGITLGNTVNQAGTAFYQAFAVVFIAQAYGIDLSIGAQISVMLTAAMVTVSLVGVPGAGTATIGILLVAAGLPPEGLGFILAVDRIVDMPRTTNNVIGDATATLVACKLDNLLDKNSPLLSKAA